MLGRCLRFGVTPRYELALALGVVGMAVVAVFYDSFYWAQIDLLMGAMGGRAVDTDRAHRTARAGARTISRRRGGRELQAG